MKCNFRGPVFGAIEVAFAHCLNGKEKKAMFTKQKPMKKQISTLLVFTILFLLPLKALFGQLVTGYYKIPKGQSQISPYMEVTVSGILDFQGTLQMEGDLDFQGTILNFNRLEWIGPGVFHFTGKTMAVDTMFINDADGVVLDGSIQVRKNLTFVNGLFQASATSPLIFASGATVTTFSATASYAPRGTRSRSSTPTPTACVRR